MTLKQRIRLAAFAMGLSRPSGLKDSDVARQVYMLTYGQPVWTPADYTQLSKQGYELNVTVYACVNEISRAFAGIEWRLFQKPTSAKGRTVEIPFHPLLDLLQRPNPWQGRFELFETFAGYYTLMGNAYMNIISDNGKGGGTPRELWTMRPDRIKVIPDAKNLISGYRYTAGSSVQDIPFERVYHMKSFHPTDDWYGLSPIQVASRVVDADNDSLKWNKMLLQNGASPSGALAYEPGTGFSPNLTDEQFTTLKKRIDEQYSGAENAGRPLLLEGGLKWYAMGLNPKEMDWINGRKMTSVEICRAFNVPPEMIGDAVTKTYSNYQEARLAFYEENVLPTTDRCRDGLNNALTPRFGDRLHLDYNPDDVEALQEKRQAKWDQAGKADWLTINEKRLLTGYGEIDGGDTILIPAAMIPLGATSSQQQGAASGTGNGSAAGEGGPP